MATFSGVSKVVLVEACSDFWGVHTSIFLCARLFTAKFSGLSSSVCLIGESCAVGEKWEGGREGKGGITGDGMGLMSLP